MIKVDLEDDAELDVRNNLGSIPPWRLFFYFYFDYFKV
jgi:hypothetical protein